MPTRWILTPVNRRNDDAVVRHPEIQRVGNTINDGPSRLATLSRKREGALNDTCHSCVDFDTKLLAKPGAPCFVPAMGFEGLGLGLRPKDKRSRHPCLNSLRGRQPKGWQTRDLPDARPSGDRVPLPAHR